MYCKGLLWQTRRLTFLFLVLFSIIYSVEANEDVSSSEELPIEDAPLSLNPLDYWKFTPAIGLRIINLEVTRKSDGYSGELTNDDNVRDGHLGDLLYFSFNIETPAWMFSDDYGISLRSQTQNIDVFRQTVASQETESGEDSLELGTRVNGYYTYIGPTIFARLHNMNNFGLTERIGLGVVYWKGNVSGDIILAPNKAAAPGMPRTNINDVFDDEIGPFVYYQWVGKRLFAEISFTSVSFSNDEYKSKLEELNLAIGVTF